MLNCFCRQCKTVGYKNYADGVVTCPCGHVFNMTIYDEELANAVEDTTPTEKQKLLDKLRTLPKRNKKCCGKH